MRYIFVLLLIASCSPAKRLERIYTRHPDLLPHTTIEIKRDTVLTVEYRDTTLFVHLPADTVREIVEIIYNEQTKQVSLKMDTVTAETKRAKAKAWVDNWELNMLLTDKDTTLEIRLQDALRDARHWYNEYTASQTVITRHKAPTWMWVASVLGMVLSLLIIAWLFHNFR